MTTEMNTWRTKCLLLLHKEEERRPLFLLYSKVKYCGARRRSVLVTREAISTKGFNRAFVDVSSEPGQPSNIGLSTTRLSKSEAYR
jgi:hypothetical protein